MPRRKSARNVQADFTAAVLVNLEVMSAGNVRLDAMVHSLVYQTVKIALLESTAQQAHKTVILRGLRAQLGRLRKEKLHVRNVMIFTSVQRVHMNVHMELVLPVLISFLPNKRHAGNVLRGDSYQSLMSLARIAPWAILVVLGRLIANPVKKESMA